MDRNDSPALSARSASRISCKESGSRRGRYFRRLSFGARCWRTSTEVLRRSANSVSGTFPYNSRSTESFSGVHVFSNWPVTGLLWLVMAQRRSPSVCSRSAPQTVTTSITALVSHEPLVGESNPPDVDGLEYCLHDCEKASRRPVHFTRTHRKSPVASLAPLPDRRGSGERTHRKRILTYSGNLYSDLSTPLAFH